MLLDNRKTQVIEIEVTQEDIDKGYALMGSAWRSQSCAVAQALKRTLGGSWGVTHESAIEFNEAGQPVRTLDHDGHDLVLAFDYHEAKPGRVVLKPESLS